MRVESPWPSRGGGWRHKLTNEPMNAPKRMATSTPAPSAGHAPPWWVPPPNFAAMAERFDGLMTDERYATLAQSLGVSLESLRRLRCGWVESQRAFSFPMRDARGQIVGIRVRDLGGAKWAIDGSHNGLFIPTGFKATPSFAVCEGPTDVAALLTIGIEAIGRSWRGGDAEAISAICERHRPRVVVMADAKPEEVADANALARVIATRCEWVKVILPPTGIKDAREWVKSGLTKATLRGVIEATQSWRMEQ